MWADSAYPPETWSVAPFRKPINRKLTLDQRTYNYWVSKVSVSLHSTLSFLMNLNGFYYLQICIHVEHTIGLLKGTFQSLKEIRIQLINTKQHIIIIIWARTCIVLHNLIIHIKGDNFDKQWRECLVRTGLDNMLSADGDANEKDKPRSALEQAQRRLETPRQRFRTKVMDDLFNSPSLRTVEHHT
jgi:hypothetical protein